MDQALATWQADTTGFRAEIARTTFLKSKVMGCLGDGEAAKSLRQDAIEMQQKLVPAEYSSHGELTEQDFDGLVTFWSR